MQSRGAVAVADGGRGGGGDAGWGESDDIELSLSLSIGGCFGKMQSMPLLHIELRRGPRIKLVGRQIEFHAGRCVKHFPTSRYCRRRACCPPPSGSSTAADPAERLPPFLPTER
jgi:hypothetical protein